MKKDLDVILSYTKETETGCMEWTRCLNTDGYPRANIGGDVNIKVHRVVYQLVNPTEDITKKVVRHTCDNPKCINPSHLLSGTNYQNILDRTSRDRAQGLRTKDVLLIRELFLAKKYTTKELSILFNVTQNTIYYSINKRKVGT